MAELIQETKDYIEALGYSKNEIKWIGGRDFVVPINSFWDSPPQVYDAGYGWTEVATDLVIVFTDDTWLERQEYDGSEWWEYKSCPKMPSESRTVTKFVSDNYATSLKEINKS